MKILLLFLSMLISSLCFAQAKDTITDDGPTALTGDFNYVSPDSAKYHVDELTIVCGKVTGVHTTASQTTFINFGAPFPNNSFTAVIMAKDTAAFKEFNPF